MARFYELCAFHTFALHPECFFHFSMFCFERARVGWCCFYCYCHLLFALPLSLMVYALLFVHSTLLISSSTTTVFQHASVLCSSQHTHTHRDNTKNICSFARALSFAFIIYFYSCCEYLHRFDLIYVNAKWYIENY